MWITMWITCGLCVEKSKTPYFIRGIMWKTNPQNTTCKLGKFMHIILLQEDSMSGGCVF